MTRPNLALASIDAARRPHDHGHTCTDGKWWNPNTGTRSSCPTRLSLLTAATQVQHLFDQVHEAAHDDDAAVAVAEGMTGLVMVELAEDDAEGWTTTARMAIEALAAHLDHDPDLEARAAAAHDRMAAALARGAATDPFGDHRA